MSPVRTKKSTACSLITEKKKNKTIERSVASGILLNSLGVSPPHQPPSQRRRHLYSVSSLTPRTEGDN